VLSGQPALEQLGDRADRSLLARRERGGLCGQLLASPAGVGEVAGDGDRPGDAAAGDRVGADADLHLPATWPALPQ
jgi:hypothetical protein